MMRISMMFLVPMLMFAPLAATAQPVQMFDGETLEGWSPIGGAQWDVRRGEIIGRTGDGSYGWLVSDNEYANFMLTFEVKTEELGNSGLQIRSHVVDGKMHGYQVEIDPNPGKHAGGIYEEHGRGWLVQPEPEDEDAFIHGEWNAYRVTAVENVITIRLNGKEIARLEDDENQARMGVIALQVHSGEEPPVEVRFRNVRIENYGLGTGWESMFDGESLEGWTNIGQEQWWVEDGTLVGKAVTEAYGYLASEKTYKDLEVALYYMAESTGNSGLFYHSEFEGVDVKGVQCEIDPTPGQHTGGLYESAGRGWLIQPTEMAEKLVKPLGEWNHIILKVKGRHIQTWVNGLKAVDYVNEDAKYFDGVVALQLHSGGEGGIRFRDIKIREPR